MSARSRRKEWAVFLDRDGTLLRLVPYLKSPARAQLHAGAAEALRRLQQAGARLVVVTNQAGVARGLLTMDDVAAVNRKLSSDLRRSGVTLDAIEVCPHHPEFGRPCSCRKPAPGMIRRAARRLGIDLGQSWTVGDNLGDLGAGRAAGSRTVLVLTGYGRATARLPGAAGADIVAATLATAARRILAVRRRSPASPKAPRR